jgi:potassium efflux system protein
VPIERELHGIAELLSTLLVFLRRPMVQVQFVAFAAALGLAWILTDGLSRLTRGRTDRAVRGLLGADRSPLMGRVVAVLSRLEFPAVSALALYLAGLALRAAGWPRGLLNESAYVLWLLLAYRVIAALVEITLGEDSGRLVRKRFLAPLVAVLAVARGLGFLIDLRALGAVRLVTVSETPILLGALASTGVALYFLFGAAAAAQRILQSAILPRTGAEPGTVNAVLTVARYLLIAVAASFALSALGFDTSTVAFVSGGLTVAVGFGSQQVFANLVSGLILLFDQSLRPGDVVNVAGEMGVVESLSIRSTTIRTPDNVAVVMPNQSFVTGPIRNYSKNTGAVRLQIPVNVAFEGEPRRVGEILLAAVRAHRAVLHRPAPGAHIAGFGRMPSGKTRVAMQVTVWLDAPLRMVEVTSDLHLAMYDALAAHDMEIV